MFKSRHNSLANLPITNHGILNQYKKESKRTKTRTPSINQNKTTINHINNFEKSDYYQAKELKTTIEKLLHHSQISSKNSANAFYNENINNIDINKLSHYRNKYSINSTNLDQNVTSELNSSAPLIDMSLINHALRKDEYNLCTSTNDPTVKKNHYKP